MDNKQEYDYGIVLLKVLMAFEVVCCHFYNNELEESLRAVHIVISGLYNVAVPVFMMCSFYIMSSKSIGEWSNKDLLLRVRRLWMPNLTYGTLCFIFFNLMAYYHGDKLISVTEMLIQVATGCSYHIFGQMWFNTDLIILTVALWIILAWFSERKKCFKEAGGDVIAFGALISIVVCAFVLQYSGINHYAFQNMPFCIKYTLGRLVEMVPYAALGIILGKQKEKRISQLCIIAIGIIAAVIINKLVKQPQGYTYQGLDVLYKTLLIWAAVYYIPIKKSNVLRKVIGFIAFLTPEIYYTHVLVGTLWLYALDTLGRPLRNVYLATYLTCMLLAVAIHICASRIRFRRKAL